MIRALDRAAEVTALRFTDSRSAMAAHVVKRAHVSMLVFDNDQTLARNFRDEEIAGTRELLEASDANPLMRKNMFAFEFEHVGRPVPPRVERFLPRCAGLDERSHGANLLAE
jgi:hypothetical protein